MTITRIKAEEDDRKQEDPFHGDVLEAIVTHVSLVDLAPASHVSREWNRAVFSSLRNLNRIKPWFMVHTQSKRSPKMMVTRAYDPRSCAWVEITKPVNNSNSAVLRSSHSALLYTMTPAKLSFSVDPLNRIWRDVKGPHVWRTDPIVAVVGSQLVVVAGGACDFEENALAVEIYEIETSTWRTSESMPNFFKDCASATWLSVAADDKKMFITEKRSGVTYSFEPILGLWQGPYDLHRADPRMLFSTIGFMNNQFVLVGLIGGDENGEKVKIWKSNSGLVEWEEIGEMPISLVKKLKGENEEDDESQIESIKISCAGNVVYMYNPTLPEEIVVCELCDGGDGVCRWGNVRNVVLNDTTRMGTFQFTSSIVDIEDIQMAAIIGNWKFSMKYNV